MAQPWLLATEFAAAAAMLGVAVWLLALGFARPANRAFAVVLVLNAALILLTHGQALVDAPAAAFLDNLSVYYLLATPFAVGWFLLEYPRRHPRHRAAKVAVLAALLVAETAYALDHCRVRCTLGDGTDHLGLLGLLLPAFPVFMATCGLLMARASARLASPSQRGATALVAVAFIVDSLLDSSIVAGFLVGSAGAWTSSFSGPWSGFAFLLSLGALPIDLAALALLARRASFGAVLTLCAAAAATGFFVGSWPGGWQTLAIGLWRLLMPVLVAYALLKHHLFDLEVRVSHGVARAMSGGLVVASFFIASELAAAYLSAQVGTYMGIVVAGLVVFAIAPVQGRLDRVVERTLPLSRRLAALDPEAKLALYRHQVELAWLDGRLDPGERVMLEQLRLSLGVSETEAAQVDGRVETQALRDLPTPMDA